MPGMDMPWGGGPDVEPTPHILHRIWNMYLYLSRGTLHIAAIGSENAPYLELVSSFGFIDPIEMPAWECRMRNCLPYAYPDTFD